MLPLQHKPHIPNVLLPTPINELAKRNYIYEKLKGIWNPNKHLRNLSYVPQ